MSDATVIPFPEKIKSAPDQRAHLHPERRAALERGAKALADEHGHHLATWYRFYGKYPLAAFETLSTVIKGRDGALPPGEIVMQLGHELEEMMLTGLCTFGLRRRKPGPGDG